MNKYLPDQIAKFDVKYSLKHVKLSQLSKFVENDEESLESTIPISYSI